MIKYGIYNTTEKREFHLYEKSLAQNLKKMGEKEIVRWNYFPEAFDGSRLMKNRT